MDNLERALELLRDCPEDLRDWEWSYLDRYCRIEPIVLRDSAEVHAVSFHPDGDRVAAGCGDGTIKIWDLNTGKVVQTLPGHESYVFSVAFSTNHLRLAQRRGMRSSLGPSLSITSPTDGAIHFTSATNLDLAGSAEAHGPFVTPVTWENVANNLKGTGAGTLEWDAPGIPLQANRTNLVVVTATTTSWASAFGGSTTFNDTLTVVSMPPRATLVLQDSDVVLNWTGGAPPYRVQRATDLTGDWMDVLMDAIPPVTLTREGRAGFYRVVGAW